MTVPSSTRLLPWKRPFGTRSSSSKKSNWIKPKGFETEVQLYNPLTKSKVPLILKNPNILTWYACGPTVYDYSHIGHASSYVKLDTIRRVLAEYFDVDSIVAMGITNVDDKIIKRSNETGEDWRTMTRFFEEAFFKDMRALNVREPYVSCRVSEYVPTIIHFVSDIVAKGRAYVSRDGSVYFDTTRCDDYGKLCPPHENSSHPEKRSALDFALWKAAKEGEPSWDSPWGLGRPGWHVECSAMASAILGNTIDIHSGGIDLLFPHHENEEAQSCSYHGVEQWVNYWLHTGHLHLEDEEKMSKSLQNTVGIQDLLGRYTADEFRLFCLLSPYRNGIEFSHEKMINAVSLAKKLRTFVNTCDDYVAGRLQDGDIDEASLFEAISESRKTIRRALADDFNTRGAISSVEKIVTIGNRMFSAPKDAFKSRSLTSVATASTFVSSTLAKLGLNSPTNIAESGSNEYKEIVDDFVAFRSVVRSVALRCAPKDEALLKACDVARKGLSRVGIELKDQENSSTWRHTKG